MSGALLTLSCPCCAGLLSVAEGDTNTVCRHCGNRLLLPGGVRRYISRDLVGSSCAARAVRERLLGPGGALPEGSAVKSARLYYVPFWSVTCRVDGYVLGTRPLFVEKEIDTEAEFSERGHRPAFARKKVRYRTGSGAVEQGVSLNLDITVSGARLEPLGIPSLGSKTQMALSGMELGRGRLPEGLSVFDSGNLPEGTVVDPVVGLQEAREEAGSVVERLSRGAGPDLEQRAVHLSVTGKRERLVYYPLWTVGFTVRGDLYTAVVDGRTGAVLTGRFPSDARQRRRLLMFAGAFAAALTPPVVHGLATASPGIFLLGLLGAALLYSVARNVIRLAGAGIFRGEDG